jgi:hypothetical protein
MTFTQRATDTAREDMAELQRYARRYNGRLWSVRIFDIKEADVARDALSEPYLAASFLVGADSGQLRILRWTISGLEILPTTKSRLPLALLARLAVFAVEDALAADDVLTYEVIMAQELTYIGSLAEPGGQVVREYRVVNGEVQDPRSGLPRPRRAPPPTAKRVELRERVRRAAEEYQRAVRRESRTATLDVAAALGLSRASAARAIAEARRLGMLGAALEGRAGEQR